MEISWNTKVMKQYPYRTAFVKNKLLTVDRTQETIDWFEAKLAAACKSHVNNHTAYQLQAGDGTIFYIGCSDRKYYIGLEIDEHSW